MDIMIILALLFLLFFFFFFLVLSSAVLVFLTDFLLTVSFFLGFLFDGLLVLLPPFAFFFLAPAATGCFFATNSSKVPLSNASDASITDLNLSFVLTFLA